MDSVAIVQRTFVRAHCLFFLALLLCAVSCEPQVRDRPFGYLEIGPLTSFATGETVLNEKWLIVRRDGAGLSAMSTLSTHDLTELVIERRGDASFLISKYEPRCTFDWEGNVVSGPAVKGLPYYELVIASSTGLGPLDTVYAKIGTEVPRTWRLQVP